MEATLWVGLGFDEYVILGVIHQLIHVLFIFAEQQTFHTTIHQNFDDESTTNGGDNSPFGLRGV